METHHVPRYPCVPTLVVPLRQTLPNYSNLAADTQPAYPQGMKSVNVFHYMADLEGPTYATTAPYSSLSIPQQVSSCIPQHPSAPSLSTPSLPDCPFLGQPTLGGNTQTHLDDRRLDPSRYGSVFPSAASGYQEFNPTSTTHFTPQYTQTFAITSTTDTYFDGCQSVSGSPSTSMHQGPRPQFPYDNFRPTYTEPSLASSFLSVPSLQCGHRPGHVAVVAVPTYYGAIGA